MTISVQLAVPPSTNALFKTLPNGRRARTAAYDRWIEAAGYEVRMAARGIGTPKPPLRLTIDANVTHNRDVSNLIKPIEDVLVKCVPGLPDDRWNDEIVARRDPSIAASTAIVTIESLAPG